MSAKSAHREPRGGLVHCEPMRLLVLLVFVAAASACNLPAGQLGQWGRADGVRQQTLENLGRLVERGDRTERERSHQPIIGEFDIETSLAVVEADFHGRGL